MLKSKQDSVRGSFEEANASVAERQKTLASALQHRRDFYGRLNDMEKWVKKMQRKLDSGSEIYSDEVGDTMAKLKVRCLLLECKYRSDCCIGIAKLHSSCFSTLGCCDQWILLAIEWCSSCGQVFTVHVK